MNFAIIDKTQNNDYKIHLNSIITNNFSFYLIFFLLTKGKIMIEILFVLISAIYFSILI